MKYRVVINKEKLDELKRKLQPGYSWWALVGIIVFFFIPEVIAYNYGEDIIKYFLFKEHHSTNFIMKFIYKHLKSLGNNSIFNITVGVGFIVWFFIGRRDKHLKS